MRIKRNELNTLNQENEIIYKGNGDTLDKENNFLKNIPLSKIFNITNKGKIEYCFLKVIPDRSITDEQKTYLLAKAIYSILNMKVKSIKNNHDGSVTTISKEKALKINYVVDLNKKVNFYFMCPVELEVLLKEKIYEVFKNVQIESVKDIQYGNFFETDKKGKTIVKKNVSTNKINLKYNDALSLNTDCKLNNLEELIINHHWIKENERVLVVFSFSQAIGKKFKALKEECCRMIANDEKRYKLLNNKLNADYTMETIINSTSAILEVALDTFSGILGGIGDNGMNRNIDKRINRKRKDPLQEISIYSREKFFSQHINAEIIVVSQSEDLKRRNNNLKLITESFLVMNEENEFEIKRTKLNKTLEGDIKMNNQNIMSLKEVSKFLILPNKTILSENVNVEQIKTKQSNSPDFLKSGNFRLGLHKYRDSTCNVFIPKAYNSESLGYVLVAPQGGGKTTFIQNLCKNAYDAKQANIFLDYIKNCESAEAIKKVISNKDDLVEMTIENISSLPKIDFNEYDISKLKDEELIGKAISYKIYATENIINTLNEEKELTANMSDILSNCCQIVYSIPGTNFGDVIDFITDFEERIKFLKKAEKITFKDSVLKKKLKEAIKKVDILNEYKKKDGKRVIVGTMSSKINGITARISKIKKSFILYKMVYGEECKVVDFVDLIEQKKTVLIRLPEHLTTPEEKNVISTFIAMKVISAIKLRGGMYINGDNPPRCNFWVDEIYQVRTVEDVINRDLSQLRKYGLKIILSVHRMSQLKNKMFKDELLGSGASFSLLRGCKEIQVRDFEDRLGDFTYEDVYNLEPFHALHIINSNEYGEWVGVTKMPPKLN